MKSCQNVNQNYIMELQMPFYKTVFGSIFQTFSEGYILL